jgi:hypothetical protein
MGDQVKQMRLESRYSRMPPMHILFLHRKLGGLYLLLSRLRATVNIAELASPYLDTHQATTSGNAA